MSDLGPPWPSCYNILFLFISEPSLDDVSSTAITSDGGYIYLHNKNGMFKIGTGYGGTLKVMFHKWVNKLEFNTFKSARKGNS